MTFKILDHLEKLKIEKELPSEYRCICPVCEGNNLTISKDSGAYQCWSGCDVADIRNEIAPLNPPKSIRPKSDRNWTYTDREGNPLIRTCRVDDGEGGRSIWQEYKTDGTWQKRSTPRTKATRAAAKKAVMPYNYAEAMEAAGKGEPIIWVEGETCVDALKEVGITAVTTIGGCGSYKKYGDYSQLFQGAKLAISPDCDQLGLKYAEDVARDYSEAQWLYPFPGQPCWNNPPKDGGRDIVDWIEDLKTEDLSLDKIKEVILGSVESRESKAGDREVLLKQRQQTASTTITGPCETFLQQAEHDLYGNGDWICFNGTLYCWAGNHYKPCPDETEYPRVKRFADNFRVEKHISDGGTKVTYPYATPHYVKQVLDWVKQGFCISAEQVNPPGLNCINGVLEVGWAGKDLIVNLKQHDPAKHFYVSEPHVRYDPDTDSTEYERLMECLDPSSRRIWERTIAASIDLPTVRKFRGRGIKALFLKGDGSNGKDTLRVITEMVMGTGAIANCSVIDWKQYDSGRYFPIYTLRSKRINWPSENADVGRVDTLRGLRAAITGDPITFEAKNKMGSQEPCNSVFLFNCNETPNILAQLKATSSRWGIVPFNKTYSLNPSSDELLADPRYKEDPSFVKEKILPAFLNALLKQLQAVVIEGIDYSATQGIFEELQRENSHLLQFAHDTGLDYSFGGKVSVQEIWKKLKNWYIETGTLEVEETATKRGGYKEKFIWHDQPRRSDRNVKASNQIVQRFLEVFPKAKKATQRTGDNANKTEVLITGIKFSEVCRETGVRDLRGLRGESEDYTGQELQNPGKDSTDLRTDLRDNSTDLRDSESRTPNVCHRTPTVPQFVPQQRTLEPSLNGHSRHSVGHVPQKNNFTLENFDKEVVNDDDF